MKNIFGYFIFLLILTSCSIKEDEILNLNISPDEISKIELRADHKTLLPDGIAKMEFHTLVYVKRKVTSIQREEEDPQDFYTKEVDTTLLIPGDQVPAGLIKVYDQTGKVAENNVYSTTTDAPGTVKQFYAKCGNIESNRLDITIRALPDESYEEVVVPVVFHILIPPATGGPSYEVSREYLERTLQRVSDIYNRRSTTDPNGGNAKVTFKLALYDQSGTQMQEAGKNIKNITQTDFDAMGTSTTKTTQYRDYILKNASQLIWDPNRYLNVWLARFTSSTSATGGSSYLTLPPDVMHPDYELASIPGLSSGIKHQATYSKADVKDCRQAGMMVNIRDFLATSVGQGRNEFTLAVPIAEFFGILQTRCDKYKNLNADGDSDYCPDTYSYDYGFYPGIYKANNLDGQPDNDPTRPLEYFTSFNIMDIYSHKNSLSLDQVKRLRMVMKQCPSRWCYKSQWAFTGHE